MLINKGSRQCNKACWKHEICKLISCLFSEIIRVHVVKIIAELGYGLTMFRNLTSQCN